VIKCLTWDLDNTLFAGVYLESADQSPPVDPGSAAVLAELAGRGILQAIASRNPPQVASYAAEATGHQFAAAQCGWGAKSDAIAAILAELGLTQDEVAFVDDDALERAEVSFALPGVLVLAPEDLPEAVAWPQFSPPVITAEGRRRGELYARRRTRQAEAVAFGGSPEAFLRYCGTQVRIGRAESADLPRLHELSVRTHQFNSAGLAVSETTLAGLLTAPGHEVVTVRLADRFGDDGLVGGAVIRSARSTWQVPLLMMSCRAMGRGVIGPLLTWIGREAARAGATEVAVASVVNERNVPLRIALTSAGFRARTGDASTGDASTGDASTGDASTGQPAWARPAGQSPGSNRTVAYRISLDQPLAELPDWVVTDD
jgi:methoxymalonate biosynthesis protein